MHIDYGYRDYFEGISEALSQTGTTAEKLAVAISAITSSLGNNIESIIANINELQRIVGDINGDGELKNRINSIENVLQLNDWGNNRIDNIEQELNSLQCRTDCVESEVYNYLRPVLDETTEKSKQIYELEILKQKARNDIQINFDTNDLDNWYDNFMKELDETYGSLD